MSLGLMPRSCKRLKLFISYARADDTLAAEIAQAFRNNGDTVFFDADSLVPGADFIQKIKKSVRRSDRFIFLASPASLSDGRYTLSELNAAKARWRSPVGRVITVMVEPNADPLSLEPYLRSVHILQPSGNTVAEVVSAIDRGRGVGLFCRVVGFLMVMAFIAAALFGALTYLGQNSRDSRLGGVEIGRNIGVTHFTGTPVVLSQLTFQNNASLSKVFTLTSATLTSPDGLVVDVGPISMIVGQMEQPPRLNVFVEPKSDMAFTYELRATVKATWEVHRQIGVEFTRPEYANIMSPQPGLLNGKLLHQLEVATEEDWLWSAGIWSLEINYLIGDFPNDGDLGSSALEFQVSERDVSTMRSSIDSYETGAGVFPLWRGIDQYSAGTVRNIVGHVPELDDVE